MNVTSLPREGLLSIVIAIAFLISIVPLLLISRANYPSADDYTYALAAHHAWENSHSIVATIRAAIHEAWHSYQVWQGTFVSVFFMALQPAVFGERFYFLVPFIMLSALIGSTGFLFRVVLIDYLGANKFQWISITFILLFLSIQLTPSPVEAFYWYNGSIHYVMMHSVMLCTIGILLLLLNEMRERRILLYVFLATMGGFLVGGGNYTTALSLLITLAAMPLYLWCAKHYKRAVVLAIPLAGAMTSFVISALAPGNVVRQQYFNKLPAGQAILKSFEYSYKLVGEWVSWETSFFLLIVVWIAWQFVNHSKQAFRHPVIVIVLSYCLFSSMLCPPLYAMSVVGPGRTINVIYFAFLALLFVVLVYCVGWMRRAVQPRIMAGEFGETLRGQRAAIPVPVVSIVLWVSFVAFRPSAYTSTSAYLSLRNGEASLYREVAEDRINVLRNTAMRDVVLKKHSAKPRLVFFDDITNDAKDWRNVAMANFYGKASVSLGPE